MFERAFTIDYDQHFASLRAQGVEISEQVEATARRVYEQANPRGNFFSSIMNAFVSGLRAVAELFTGRSSNIEEAADNGQQRGDMRTAATTAYDIRNRLIQNGVPVQTAEIMTGAGHNDASLHHTGNLYQMFTNSTGVNQRNRDAERERDEARNPPSLDQLISTTTASYPVADNPTVAAPTTPSAVNPTRALTGQASPA